MMMVLTTTPTTITTKTQQHDFAIKTNKKPHTNQRK